MITIVDYKAGNIKSIQNMIKKIGFKSKVSENAEDILNAEKLILPGVGSFDYGMSQLKRNNLINVLNEKALNEKTPILGICLGAQLFTEESEEGEEKGLSWFEAKTLKFNKEKLPNQYKVPHMGWAEVEYNKESKLFFGIEDNPRFYFVHSYHLKANNEDDILSEATYGYKFTAGLEKNNLIGIQFHPEKSHKFGMQVLKNFIVNY